MSKLTEAKQRQDVSFEPIPHRLGLPADPTEIALLLEEAAEILRLIRQQSERPLPIIA